MIIGQSDPGANTTTQGWAGIHIHDPSIILGPDGHYYSFSTHGLIVISRTSEPYSLHDYWEIIGSVLESGSSVINNTGSTDPWAPDVHKVGNTYYCYYSVSQFGSQISSIGLATSPSLQPGTWTDHGALLSTSPTDPSPLNITNAIDPNLFIDPATNIPYLNYGSFWSDIYQYNLAQNLSTVISTEYRQLSFDPVLPQAEEGSFMNYHDGWYYLWYSHGLFGRSKSPQGPFVDMNGTDLKDGGGYIAYGTHDYVYAPGGQGVLSEYNGRDVLYYHYIDTIQNPDYLDELKFRLGLYRLH
ncbi:glycosyl hydrolase [Delphinella strobiligena]|nr:glycosyl hydrolase [Delphinella strobiligena]